MQKNLSQNLQGVGCSGAVWTVQSQRLMCAKEEDGIDCEGKEAVTSKCEGGNKVEILRILNID